VYGFVYDGHMSDALYSLKRQFEKIASEKNPIMLEHRTADKTKEWNDCYYCHPNSTQAATLTKRIRALEKVDNNLAGLLMPIAHRLMLKQAEIMVQKDADLKARNERKAAAQAKREEKETIKRNPYHRLDKQVADILRQVAEPYRVAAVEMEKAILTNRRDEVVTLAKMFNNFDPRVIFPYKKGDHYGNQVNAIKATEAMKFIEKDRNDTWSLKTNTDEIIQASAEQFAADMVIQFIHKVGMKLSGIVEKKNGTHTVSITGGTLRDYWMSFKFADGASFDVQSQVVWKVSVNGVHFPQFPTCFRNVILSNGAKMELPSEAKMKESFV
jgi:hypothetical protein